MPTSLNLEAIHRPLVEPSAFPFAYGWYLLALAILVTLFFILFTAYQWHKRTKLRRAAEKQLKLNLSNFNQDQNAYNYVKRNLLVIKQVCKLKHPQALALSGQKLADFLNQTQNCFCDDSVFALTQGLYKKEKTLNVEQLHQDCCKWLRGNA